MTTSTHPNSGACALADARGKEWVRILLAPTRPDAQMRGGLNLELDAWPGLPIRRADHTEQIGVGRNEN